MLAKSVAAMLICCSSAAVLDAQEITPDQQKFFETKIRPVLARECYGCHSNKAGKIRGGLRLDTLESMRLGGSSGPAIVPGDLEASLLFSAINHNDFEMPPKRKLPKDVIDDFQKWIGMGAPDPRIRQVAEVQSTVSKEDIEKARKSFWAYQKPRNVSPPNVENAAWPRGNIDRFVLARLEQSEIRPAADADPATVLRRLCFDLIGLPPTPEEINDFNDRWKNGPDQAVAVVVDRLLKNEHFGERWGRHWLDVARYAESTGRETNYTYPHAWRYRDYVIDAFNDDKPYDLFVREQLAGDLIPAQTDEDWAENLIATTFLAMGSKKISDEDRRQFEADLVDEQIDATTRLFLGLSVSCARCHDHKFDAISQRDYYALAGVFSNMTTYFGNPPSKYGNYKSLNNKRNSSLLRLPVDDPFGDGYTSTELEALKAKVERKSQQLRLLSQDRQSRQQRGQSTTADQNNRLIGTLSQLAELTAKLANVDDNGKPLSFCMGVQERAESRDSPLLVRGQIDQPADVVPRGVPQVLCATPVRIDSAKSGRLELARFIGSNENTLAARVMVNRIWKHLIGQGIVASTEDFGVTGQTPSHPELLDYLAVRFVESSWSMKSIIREIATSHVYRIASTHNQAYHEYDPENKLLWRAHARRLDAEAIRDSMLFVSGQLNRKRPRGSEVAKAGYIRIRGGIFGDFQMTIGSAVQQKMLEMRDRDPRQGGSRGGRRQQDITAEVFRELAGKLDMETAKFRSVYLPVMRDETPRSLEVFDFPDASTVTGNRESSHTANQALYMMNNRFVIGQGEAFADRLSQAESSTDQQVNVAFLIAFGRRPTSGERTATLKFIRNYSSESNQRDTMAAFCQSLFASAEFRIIE